MWKKTKPINLVHSGGHFAVFENRKVFPRNFVLRHYLTLSKNHLIAKYVKRVFSPEELRKGWPGKRACLVPEDIQFPAKKDLREYRGEGIWDEKTPWKRHFFNKA